MAAKVCNIWQYAKYFERNISLCFRISLIACNLQILWDAVMNCG